MTKRTACAKEIKILRIYNKEISLESPNSPYIFNYPWRPNSKLDFHILSHNIEKNHYEVTLKLNFKILVEKKIALICEAHQSGIFTITGLSKLETEHCLNVYCPNILFPYARECISNLCFRASFPTINLNPINFEKFFFQKQS